MMIKKTLLFFSALLLTGTIHAAPQKLENYEALKSELLQGKSVKIIVDFGKCQITSGNTGKELRHTVSLMMENFMISSRTQGISTSHSFLNSLDKRTPYALFGYRVGDITVMPNNEVIVDTAVIRLPDYTVVAPTRLSCKMAEGANFYSGIFA